MIINQVRNMEFKKVVELFRRKQRKSGTKINMDAFKRFKRVNRINYSEESVLKFLGGLK